MTKMSLRVLAMVAIMLSVVSSNEAQNAKKDVAESELDLPDPLLCLDGTVVNSVKLWEAKRRPELLKLFEQNVYGKVPKMGQLKIVISARKDSNSKVITARYVRQEYRCTLSNEGGQVTMNILVFLPLTASKENPVPLFLGYNFFGNQSVHTDPEIELASGWVRNRKAFGITANKATEKSRGVNASRWPVEEIVKRGYGLATIYYGDVDPDFDDGFKNGVHPMGYQKRQVRPAADEWGSIAGWAWGLSRALDSLESIKEVDSKKVAVIGHSRLGKTALWAGATDERFALVISNNSGCGGAALSRRRSGETVKRINDVFPHWFCDRFTKFNDLEDQLPVDQHQLVALMAPRPVYIASASQDSWADPLGEFLSAKHAAPVFKLYGHKGVGTNEMPEVNRSIGNRIGYHVRKGKHDVKELDWKLFMDFADRHLKNQTKSLRR